MRIAASSVQDYLSKLPEDRRAAVQAVRESILKNLDPTYEEGVQYGMIGYFVPHKVFPAGYHCDPKQPLPFVCLASQKGHLALYLNGVYQDETDAAWFQKEWAKTGKKLDMGKSCIRFKRAEDLALDVIGQLIRRTPARRFVSNYQRVLAETRSAKPAAPKPAAKTVAPKRAAKAVGAKAVAKAPAKAGRAGRASASRRGPRATR